MVNTQSGAGTRKLVLWGIVAIKVVAIAAWASSPQWNPRSVSAPSIASASQAQTVHP